MALAAQAGGDGGGDSAAADQGWGKGGIGREVDHGEGVGPEAGRQAGPGAMRMQGADGGGEAGAFGQADGLVLQAGEAFGENERVHA